MPPKPKVAEPTPDRFAGNVTVPSPPKRSSRKPSAVYAAAPK
jgi:hypothetical protein